MATIMRVYVGGSRKGWPIKGFHAAVARIVEECVPGATVYEAEGYWASKWERSRVIEVLATSVLEVAWVTAMAVKLRESLEQDAVMVTRHEVEVELV